MHDVVIIGCGPTGLTAALLLARQGHSVAIIDRHRAIYPLPRAIAYDHEIARILNLLGLTEAMAPHVAMPGVYQWRNQHNELLFELDWAGTASLSGFAAATVFSQPQLEQVLDAAAQAHPLITIHRGVEVSGLGQTDDGVTVIGETFMGEPVTFHGTWLIGADGANSMTRRAIGAALCDLGFEADWLVVDIQPRDGATVPLDDDLMLQVCDPARPTTVVSGGPGRRRWEFMALAGETLEQLNHADRAWDLLAPWGVNPANAALERHAVYRFRGAIADIWRDRRMFIAGDAAHLTPPFAGQGLCAGFRDAIALAWRLDLALTGRASAALLDSYATERRDHARAWVLNAIELGKVICVLDPAAAGARDAGMKAARAAGHAPPSSGVLPRLGPGTHLADRHGGTLAAGGIVVVDGQADHFDTAVGSGFVLITRGRDPKQVMSSQTADILARLGGIAVGIDCQGGVQDRDHAIGHWLDQIDADTALIRPDFYLFGAASGADAADVLITALGESVLPRDVAMPVTATS